jgi:hypothetical protein
MRSLSISGRNRSPRPTRNSAVAGRRRRPRSIESLEERLCLSSTVELTPEWARSSGVVVGDGAGTTVDEALLLDTDVTDPSLIWDSTYLYSSPPPPAGTEWASWNSGYAPPDLTSYAEGRLFRATFTLSDAAFARGVLNARLFDPFKPGGEIPINDVLYVYLNGTKITQLSPALARFASGTYGTSYGVFGVDGGNNHELAPETDGWFINALNLPAGLFVAGQNHLEIVTEDVSVSGALGYVALEVTLDDPPPPPPPPIVNVAVIDVKPGSDVNPVNLGSNGRLPVAILTTPDFDATAVDPYCVLLGDSAPDHGKVSPVKWSLEDVDDDGDLDLMLHFSLREIHEANALDASTVEVNLMGQFDAGDSLEPFEGTDHVKIVPSGAGIFRNGTWYFDMNGDGMAGEKVVAFGLPGDTPIVGDWDGDGVDDIGVFRRGVWYFDLDGLGGNAEKWFAFGVPSDTPVVGDWDGDGDVDAGVFRRGVWYFDLDGLGKKAEKSFAFGIASDVPVVGDWDGDGDTDVGVFRHGLWYKDLDNKGGNAEQAFAFGIDDDKSAVGDWDGDGDYEVAVFRGGIWYFDLDDNGGFAEASFAYGIPDDLAFTGHWGDNDSDLYAAGVDAALAQLL